MGAAGFERVHEVEGVHLQWEGEVCVGALLGGFGLLLGVMFVCAMFAVVFANGISRSICQTSQRHLRKVAVIVIGAAAVL